MPWMICKCDRRFYCLPSEMMEARCDECKSGPKPKTVQWSALRDHNDWSPDPTAGSMTIPDDRDEA